MKTLTLTISLLFLCLAGFSQNNSFYNNSYSQPKYNTQTSTTNSNVRHQSGYIKSDGTYVQPHYKTQPNKTNHDNFSTRPNVNSYTGETGTRAKDYTPGAQSYGSGRTIHTGPKGGQYYINSNGNKTYVPKR
jgi:hypothetical protein